MTDKIRPWSGKYLRLGLSFDTDSVGWMLFEMERKTGEVDVNQPARRPKHKGWLTAAELRVLRQDCGLSQREAQEFFGVSQKTMSHWENNVGAKKEAALELIGLRSQLESSASAALRVAIVQAPEAVDLYAYRAKDYPKSQPFAEGLPHGAHLRLLAITAKKLDLAGFSVLITYSE